MEPCKKVCRSKECDSCTDMDKLDMSPEEIERLREAFQELSTAIMEALKPIVEAVIEFVRQIAPLLEHEGPKKHLGYDYSMIKDDVKFKLTLGGRGYSTTAKKGKQKIHRVQQRR